MLWFLSAYGSNTIYVAGCGPTHWVLEKASYFSLYETVEMGNKMIFLSKERCVIPRSPVNDDASLCWGLQNSPIETVPSGDLQIESRVKNR